MSAPSPELLDQLNSFSLPQRQQALAHLLELNPPAQPTTPQVNMHMHTFFSFNGDEASPSRLAWDAHCAGLYAMGIVDFDVLDGLEELLQATDLLRLRATVGFESRVFFSDYADQEINSPGEPGVFYFMGLGFTSLPAPGNPAGRVLAQMLSQSHERNRALIGRINGKLEGLTVDYEADVLPLTPKGNATERHIVLAYFNKAREVSGSLTDAAAFWARVLALDVSLLSETIQDTNRFLDVLRSKMMKKGGLGYVQPTADTFPSLETVIDMISACRAVPTSTWLDGTSSGEADPEAQLDLLISKGIQAVNIIPDRNWNIKDPAERARKIRELGRYIEAARQRDLPIIVGTELNKPGQKFVDDFSAAALSPYRDLFVTGAEIMVGHTRLLRYGDLSYTDDQAARLFPTRAARNQAFAAVGRLPGPSPKTREQLVQMSDEDACAFLLSRGHTGSWHC